MGQTCLSCSEKPATSEHGTVPLCSDCAALIKNPRAVEFEAPASAPASAPISEPLPAINVMPALTQDAENLGLN